MSEFSDREFVAGSLTGIRSFRIDPLGRLTGVSQQTVWRPGENRAECLKVTMRLGGGLLTQSYVDMLYGAIYSGSTVTVPGVSTHAVRPETPPKTKHRAGELKCTCGFYAYFDEAANEYHQKDRLLGVVEGYGVTTVGRRGFRCEKATLRALVIKPKRETTLTDRVRHNYPDVPVFPSRRLALEAFPLTPSDPITPENTPDFWERAL